MSPAGHHVTGSAQFQATWAIPAGAYYGSGSALAWNLLSVLQSHRQYPKAWNRAPQSHLHKRNIPGALKQAPTPPSTWLNRVPESLTPGQNQRRGLVSASPTRPEGNMDPMFSGLFHTAAPVKFFPWP